MQQEEPIIAPPGDLISAEWIKSRLSGAFGTVTSVVPDGYSAYARICHPAEGIDADRATWSEVAQHIGRTAHPTMQWHALVGTSDPVNYHGSLWPADSPDCGNIAADLLNALCDILARHTQTPDRCYFALWEGWGWIGRDKAARYPRLHHPGRDYLVFTGPLGAAERVGECLADDLRFSRTSPNLLWPADRAWVVGTEIDFNSTLVAGSTQLIEDLLSAATLDAWPVRADDSLAADGDTLNRPT